MLERTNVAGIFNALSHDRENIPLEGQPRQCHQREISQYAAFRSLRMIVAAMVIVRHRDHLRVLEGRWFREREETPPPNGGKEHRASRKKYTRCFSYSAQSEAGGENIPNVIRYILPNVSATPQG